MKLMNDSLSRLVLTLLALGLAGCASQKDISQLSHGFETVAHSSHNLLVGEPDQTRLSLQHRGADDKVVKIWPALYGPKEVIHDELALFVGEKAYVNPEKVTRARLFAVKPPEPPLDLTDEMLWRWSQANRLDFKVALERFSLVIPEEKNGHLELHLEFTASGYMTMDKDWPDRSDLRLDWNQVSELMRAVKSKGTLQKDLRWGTPYIGEKF